MSGASEQWWEKKLNIKTSGTIDHFFEMDCNYYEPTDYRVLEALAKSGYITAENHILDYGCGLGRSVLFLSAMTGCRATGIEFDRDLYEKACLNLDRAKIPDAYKKGVRFVCEDARKYRLQDEDSLYFFNPFTDDILRIVLHRIRESYYENPRQIYLYFYYPRIIVCSQSLPVLGKRLCCYGCCGSVYIFLPPDGLRKGLTTASCYFVDQSDTA